MFHLDLIRLNTGRFSTTGVLLARKTNQFLGYTCEDEHREVKVHSKTRIPAGSYQIKYRQEGGFHARYDKRFGFHKGMLHLQNVPNFEWIYIHLGNTHKDTSGCILIGWDTWTDLANMGGVVRRSTQCYTDIYQLIAEEIDRQGVTIHIYDSYQDVFSRQNHDSHDSTILT